MLTWDLSQCIMCVDLAFENTKTGQTKIIPADTKISCINNILHSAFSEVSRFLLHISKIMAVINLCSNISR